MSSPSVIPETPRILGRFRSFFLGRQLNADDVPEPVAVPEPPTTDGTNEVQDDVSFNSTEDMSSLLLTQEPQIVTDAATPGERISTVVSDRTNASVPLAHLKKIQLFRGHYLEYFRESR